MNNDSNAAVKGGSGKPGALLRSAKRALPANLKRALSNVQRAATYLPRQCFGTITHVRTREPVAALTFDDGPTPATTPRFLALLEAHGARGTFFVIGKRAQRYPELVARIAEGGHALGNHSWDHPSFPAVSARERRRQIRAWAQTMGDAHSKLFCPPYGNQTLISRLDPLWLGWQVVAWDVSARDWTGDSAEQIAERILRRLQPGSIVLLHEALYRYEDRRFVPREATVAAVARVLEATAGRYRFVTLPELLRIGRPNREIWFQPGRADYLARLLEEPDEPPEQHVVNQ